MIVKFTIVNVYSTGHWPTLYLNEFKIAGRLAKLCYISIAKIGIENVMKFHLYDF